MDDEVDELLARGDESARAASESFAEGSGEDIDGSILGLEARATGEHVEVFVCASSCFAHDAVAVGVVYAEHGAVFVAEFAECWEVGDVAFHREDAVGDEPDLSGDFGVVLGAFECGFARFHIGVRVNCFLHAFLDDGGESHGVDDARMVKRVGDDDVSRLADGREERFGRVPATHEGVRGFSSHVLGDGLFKFMVGGEGAADEADGCGSGTVLLEGFDPGVDNLRVVGESEVVVGAHADAVVL